MEKVSPESLLVYREQREVADQMKTFMVVPPSAYLLSAAAFVPVVLAEIKLGLMIGKFSNRPLQGISILTMLLASAYIGYKTKEKLPFYMCNILPNRRRAIKKIEASLDAGLFDMDRETKAGTKETYFKLTFKVPDGDTDPLIISLTDMGQANGLRRLVKKSMAMRGLPVKTL